MLSSFRCIANTDSGSSAGRRVRNSGEPMAVEARFRTRAGRREGIDDHSATAGCNHTVGVVADYSRHSSAVVAVVDDIRTQDWEMGDHNHWGEHSHSVEDTGPGVGLNTPRGSPDPGIQTFHPRWKCCV